MAKNKFKLSDTSHKNSGENNSVERRGKCLDNDGTIYSAGIESSYLESFIKKTNYI